VIAIALCESAQIAMTMVWTVVGFCSANGCYSTAGRKAGVHRPAYPPIVAGNTICFYTGLELDFRAAVRFSRIFMFPDKSGNSPEALLGAAFRAYGVRV
jgi:hypothetical protein